MFCDESYYSQECIACGVDKPIQAFGWHKVLQHRTADGKHYDRSGWVAGVSNRGCKECWARATSCDDSAMFVHARPQDLTPYVPHEMPDADADWARWARQHGEG
jgi:hypothetical protein